MRKPRDFDFDHQCDVFNALDNLKVERLSVPEKPSLITHLTPIHNASLNSTGKTGRLEQEDIDKLNELGRCTHAKLLVLLLEPTRESSSTITWIDSFLRSSSHGTLDKNNTCILNCRALVPNASFKLHYQDSSKIGAYQFRAVERAIRRLDPEVILVCQCRVDRGMDNLVSRLTKTSREAGNASSIELGGGKPVTVINAFHPSHFAKYGGGDDDKGVYDKDVDGEKICTRLRSKRAVFRAALLEFCFLRAINAIEGIEVVGPGLGKLRDLAFGSTLEA